MSNVTPCPSPSSCAATSVSPAASAGTQTSPNRDDAVSVTVAESDADFSFLSGYGQRPVSELHNLLPELPVSDDSLTAYALQITLFPNNGFSIGVTAQHAVLDGKTLSMFFKAWAHVCKQDDRDARSSHRNPKTTFVLTTLLLSREKLRERGTEPPLVDFRPRLGYAYAWTCLVKACGGNGERLVSFLFVGDFRERLNPPLPATYFGKDGFVTAGEILSGLDLTSQFGSNRLGVYQSDLGWGRPVKTDVVSHSRRGNLHGRET
ncbi:hypothetical protein YC2023_016529 [Brassica napus]